MDYTNINPAVHGTHVLTFDFTFEMWSPKRIRRGLAARVLISHHGRLSRCNRDAATHQSLAGVGNSRRDGVCETRSNEGICFDNPRRRSICWAEGPAFLRPLCPTGILRAEFSKTQSLPRRARVVLRTRLCSSSAHLYLAKSRRPSCPGFQVAAQFRAPRPRPLRMKCPTTILQCA